MRLVIWTVSTLFAVAVSAVVIAWAVLFVPFFSDARSGLVSRILSEQLGQPVIVQHDVSVVIGRTTRFVARGVSIPSENLQDVQLAALQELSFDLDTLDILDGQIDLNNIAVRNLAVNLIKKSDGTTSWSEQEDVLFTPEQAPAEDGAEDDGILSFLTSNEVFFEDIQLVVLNEETGFEFDFNLVDYTIRQIDGGAAFELASSGTVNSEPFEVNGSFPSNAPFTISARMGSITVSYDGTGFADPEQAGYEAQLKIEVAQFSDILEVLKLNGEITGSGTLDASIIKTSNLVSMENLAVEVEMEKGQRYTLNGGISDFLNLAGIDLQFAAQFFEQGNMPAPAQELADLTVTGISAYMTSVGDNLDFEDVVVTTNAFQRDFQEIGPIAVKSIHRSESGGLAVEDISIQAGPLDAPFISVQGSILDLLQFKDLNFSGALAAPASLVFGDMDQEIVEKFGGVTAEFVIDDSQGELALQQLSARSVDTDVWGLLARIKVGDITTLDGLDLELELGIEDVASFLTALNVDPVDAGNFKIRAALTSKGEIIDGDLTLAAGATDAKSAFVLDRSGERLKITTELTSETLSDTDLYNAFATYEALNALGTSQINPARTEPDKPAVRPLVLPVEEEGLSDLVSFEKMIAETDIYGRIEFKKLVGIEGMSRLSSTLSLENGQAKLGPVDAVMDGGSFRFEAKMDAVNAPEIVTLSGTTTGWDLSDLIAEIGLDFDADGKLRGAFNLVGNLTSLETFANTMAGSARIDMSSGQIATSLLELAGLGIFPWLFSDELHRGYTTVNCFSAPVKINSGKISFDQVVAETNKVQVVTRGRVDWKADQIDLRVEPRPVGKPLAWSAVPVDVKGRLSDPDFKLLLGGSRSRRADGADVMPVNRKPCVPDIYQLEHRGGR